MDAELIAVGSELLRYARADTNGDWLSGRLNRIGVEIRGRSIVEDHVERIAAAVTAGLGRVELVVLTGGLGPTEDDRTREAVARAVDKPLLRDPEMLARLRAGYAARGYTFREPQSRQADRPQDARWIANPVGSAAGLLVEHEGRLVLALPGVPEEMRATFEAARPVIAARASRVLERRTFRVGGRTESAVDDAIRGLYAGPGTSLTILVSRDGIEVHLRAEGSTPQQARERLEHLDRELAARLGPDLVGRDDETLAAVVGGLLVRHGWTLATAESCTAGLLAATVTEVPGSSAWFRGGVVVYQDELKTSLAGVAAATLREHGAVSESVARELAAGARRATGADVGIGITGVAGPGGGSAEKPVGRVHLALHDPEGVDAWRLDLTGDRQRIRQRSAASALDRLRRRLAR